MTSSTRRHVAAPLALVRTGDAPGRLAVRREPRPSPAPDEAVVAVTATSVNRGELALLEHRPDGWRPGQDLAGTVTRAADDGTGPAVGSRVLGVVHGGSWAQLVAVPTRSLALLPDAVTAEQGATLGVAGLTALRLARLPGSLLGRDVLVTAGAGGVGPLLVQLLARAGAQVTVLTRPGRAAPGSAARTVDSLDPAADAFDVVVDGVGGRTARDALACLRPGGQLCLYGTAGGEDLHLRVEDFFGHEDVLLRPFLYYASAGHDGADLAALARLVGDGALVPPPTTVLPWDQAAHGLDLLARRAVPGKVVLTVPPGDERAAGAPPAGPPPPTDAAGAR